MRVSSTSISGKQITLTYVEPGIWFGDVAISTEIDAHTTPTPMATPPSCAWPRPISRKFWRSMSRLYEALLRLHARRIRQLYGLVEDLNTLPLRARLAKQLLHLARSWRLAFLSNPDEVRIGQQLAQEELAQLLGASRQRVNQEFKAMEREGAIRIEPGGFAGS